MEVLDQQDNPIPGLYAGGIDTGGWESDTYCLTLSGSTFGFALNSGRIAGENASKYVFENESPPTPQEILGHILTKTFSNIWKSLSSLFRPYKMTQGRGKRMERQKPEVMQRQYAEADVRHRGWRFRAGGRVSCRRGWCKGHPV
jgi:hypothetical protein